MQSLGVAIPLVPGKTEEWRHFVQEVKGPRRSEMDDFHRRTGVTENWYLQQTPQGDILVLYLQGEDLARSMQLLAASDHPFDRWLKQNWLNTEGIDWGQPLPGAPPELMYESVTH